MKRLHAKVDQIVRTWGTAWLVMIADVDAASAITAADTGAQYGTKLVWFLMLLVIPLYVIQEVAGRVGAVTSKGLGELIRENYSRRIAVLAAIPIASNKKLMGDFSLKGFNRLIYWFFIGLIFTTGIVSMLPFFGIKL